MRIPRKKKKKFNKWLNNVSHITPRLPMNEKDLITKNEVIGDLFHCFKNINNATKIDLSRLGK